MEVLTRFTLDTVPVHGIRDEKNGASRYYFQLWKISCSKFPICIPFVSVILGQPFPP